MTAHAPAQTIVITGSVKGIGYGLAQAFLERGQVAALSLRALSQVRFCPEAGNRNHRSGI